MSLGEQVVLRVVLILLLCAVVFCFRLLKSLIGKAWKALTHAEEKPRSNPPVQVKQPPAPPVIPHQPVNPPVISNQPVNPPVVPNPSIIPSAIPDPPVHNTAKPGYPAQDYEGTIPLDPNEPTAGGYAPPVPPGSSTITLTGLSGPYAGKSKTFFTGTCTIGRNPGNTVVFPPQMPGVSGNHCKVEFVWTPYPQHYLTDNHSTYGTYLGNGQRIAPGTRVPLKPGDSFFLGSPKGPGFRLGS